MRGWREFLDGLHRVRSAPAILIAAYLLTLLVGLPLAAALGASLRAHLGDSLVAAGVASGASHEWWDEFAAQARGLARSFSPEIIGFAAVIRNLSDLADSVEMLPGLAWIVAAWLLVWTFFSGGVLDGYARQRGLAPTQFFAACGLYGFRLVRLGLIALLVYGLLFGYAHGWLFERGYSWLTRDFTVERNAFAVRVALYLVFGAALALANVLFDYARIRLVVEDRHSAAGALLASWRFVRRHPRRVFMLYGLNTALFVVLAMVYAIVAPGARTWSLLALVIGQLWIVARLAVKLQFYASQIACFQGLLAHAHYVAAPVPEWPDAPWVEAVARK